MLDTIFYNPQTVLTSEQCNEISNLPVDWKSGCWEKGNTVYRTDSYATIYHDDYWMSCKRVMVASSLAPCDFVRASFNLHKFTAKSIYAWHNDLKRLGTSVCARSIVIGIKTVSDIVVETEQGPFSITQGVGIQIPSKDLYQLVGPKFGENLLLVGWGMQRLSDVYFSKQKFDY